MFFSHNKSAPAYRISSDFFNKSNGLSYLESSACSPCKPEPCREQRRRTADQGLLSCAGNRGVRRSFQLTALEIQQLPVVLNSARDYLAVRTRRIALGHILYTPCTCSEPHLNSMLTKTCCLNIYLMILMYEIVIVTREMFVIKKYCRFVISPKHMRGNYFTMYSRWWRFIIRGR